MCVPVSDKMPTPVELGCYVGKALRVIEGARISGPMVALLWAGDHCYIDLAIVGADTRCKQQSSCLAMPESSLTVLEPVLDARRVYTNV
jgi:hypothetical protein